MARPDSAFMPRYRSEGSRPTISDCVRVRKPTYSSGRSAGSGAQVTGSAGATDEPTAPRGADRGPPSARTRRTRGRRVRCRRGCRAVGGVASSPARVHDGGVRSRRFRCSGGLVTASVVVLVLGGCSVGGEAGPTARPSASDQVALDQALRAAAWANDAPTARRLVAQGADVDAKDETQQSAYLIATSEGYLDLLELALASGADVDAKDSWNGTGLIRAAERGHHLVVGRLLRAGIDKDHVNRIGYQAVHEAVWFGADAPDELATVQVLVAGGVELGRPSVTEGLTPCRWRASGVTAHCERVLSAAEGHRPSSEPDAALLAAAAAGDADAVALALRDGARLEAARRVGADGAAAGVRGGPRRGGAGAGGDGGRPRRPRRPARHAVAGHRGHGERGDAGGAAAGVARPRGWSTGSAGCR